jgi:alpha-beta hydrolase superfamily lysophospholipase
MRRMLRILLWTVVSMVTLLVVALRIAWWAARPATPDNFYTAPTQIPQQPGALLKQQPFVRGMPAGARAWLMLYTTTSSAGTPTVASAIVMTSARTTESPRQVILWTHGTTGVMPGCGPSLLAEPLANVPAVAQLLDRDWVLIAPDYAGQGTAGPNPYLIGEGEARSALDALRAARQLQGVRLDDRAVVWGHSQGGHAALWTGALAATYAPDVKLAGVAAIAPATDLPALIEANQHSVVGRIMSSFLLRAYSDNYADVHAEDYTSGRRHRAANDMAGRCLAGRSALLSVLTAMTSGDTLFDQSPRSGALGLRLAQNVPQQPVPMPLLIAQGLSDDLVLPDIQARYVHSRCEAGQVFDYRRYVGEDHLSIVAPASPLTDALVYWTSARFSGEPAAAQCVEQTYSSGNRAQPTQLR